MKNMIEFRLKILSVWAGEEMLGPGRGREWDVIWPALKNGWVKSQKPPLCFFFFRFLMWFIHVYRPLSGTSVGQLAYLVRGRRLSSWRLARERRFRLHWTRHAAGKLWGFPDRSLGLPDISLKSIPSVEKMLKSSVWLAWPVGFDSGWWILFWESSSCGSGSRRDAGGRTRLKFGILSGRGLFACLLTTNNW